MTAAAYNNGVLGKSRKMRSHAWSNKLVFPVSNRFGTGRQPDAAPGDLATCREHASVAQEDVFETDSEELAHDVGPPVVVGDTPDRDRAVGERTRQHIGHAWYIVDRRLADVHGWIKHLPSPGARSIWVTGQRWIPTIGLGHGFDSEPGTRVLADKRAGCRSGSSPWVGAGDRWPERGLVIWRRMTNRRRLRR